MKYSILLVILAITIVGCQSDIESIPKANMFSINVDAPNDLQADKPFVVNGTLINNSNTSWEITHGAGMFTYDVYDMNDELVLQDIELRMVNAIGIVKILKPNENYMYDGEGQVHPKFNELTLHTGSYKVVSKANFKIKQGGKDFDIEIESSPLKIKV
jgi:hypothetical protein